MQQRITQGIGHGIVVIVRTAKGLGHHFIDQSQLVQIFGGDLQCLSCLRGGGTVFPKNSGAAFGADDRIVSVFQNQRAIAYADAERAPAAAFADYHGDHGHAEERHLSQVNGNGLGNVAFLGGHTWVGAGGVD